LKEKNMAGESQWCLDQTWADQIDLYKVNWVYSVTTTDSNTSTWNGNNVYNASSVFYVNPEIETQNLQDDIEKLEKNRPLRSKEEKKIKPKKKSIRFILEPVEFD